MKLTPQTVAACTGASMFKAAVWLEQLQLAMALYHIDTPMRQAAFLPQIGHESGGLQWTTELWGPTEAQRRYEGRKDLGNTQPGDGFRFRGRGLIQTTGRANYIKVRDRLAARFDHVPDFVSQPDTLAEMQWAALSAADYWDMRDLNRLADEGDFINITRRINGGLNGQAHRAALYEQALRALEG